MAILARCIRMLNRDVSTVIQARPALALGLLSVALGAALAAWKTRSFSRRQALRRRLRHGRRQVKAALDLLPLVIKLLANPLVEGYLRRTVLRAVSRKLGRKRTGLAARPIDITLGRLRLTRHGSMTKRS